MVRALFNVSCLLVAAVGVSAGRVQVVPHASPPVRAPPVTMPSPHAASGKPVSHVTGRAGVSTAPEARSTLNVGSLATPVTGPAPAFDQKQAEAQLLDRLERTSAVAPAGSEPAVLAGTSAARVPRDFDVGVARQAAAKEEGASESVDLVPITDEAKVTTAGVLGGLVGLLVGGVWVGAGLFVASSFFAKRDDDAGKALRGIAASGLDTINFASYINDKNKITDNIGSAIDEAATKAGSSSGGENQVKNTLDSIKSTIADADKDINFKDTVGTLATSAADLASQLGEKAVDINDKYKVTDQIADKITEVTEKAKASTAPKSS